MGNLSPKRPRLKLDRAAYQALLQRVLRRDRWQGQWCGDRTGVQVHHLTHRSRHGDDAEANLITLCSRCHRNAHGPAKAPFANPE